MSLVVAVCWALLATVAAQGASDEKLSNNTGAKIGIALGVVGGLILIGGCWMMHIRSQSSKHAAAAASSTTAAPSPPKPAVQTTLASSHHNSNSNLLQRSNNSVHSNNNHSQRHNVYPPNRPMQDPSFALPPSHHPAVSGYASYPSNAPSPYLSPVGTVYPPSMAAQPAQHYHHAPHLQSAVFMPSPSPPLPPLHHRPSQASSLSQQSQRQQEIHLVVSAFTDLKSADEILLRTGDRVCVDRRFDDGWAYGLNINTTQSGMFPVVCLSALRESQQQYTNDAMPVHSTGRQDYPIRTLSRS